MCGVMQRALSGARDFAQRTLSRSIGRPTALRRARCFAQALAPLFVARALAAVSKPSGGRHASPRRMLGKANLGKLTILSGSSQYDERA